MKTLLLVVAALVVSVSAEASLKKGNIEADGFFNLSHTSAGGGRTAFALDADGQYFFMDHFSAGLNTSWQTAAEGFSAVSIGPIATQYFSMHDKWAPYVSVLPFNYTKIAGVDSTESSGLRIGAKYFITDAIAFGPAAYFNHEWGADRENIYGLLGQFSMEF
jgi:hypothetical protein